MSVSSDVRAALADGLIAALGGLTPPAEATPFDPAENASPAKGCAWIVKAIRSYEPRHLGGAKVDYREHITYTIDFQCYREAAKHSDAALAAQTRVDEMVDAFTDWLSLNVSLNDTCLMALPLGSSDEDAELEPRPNGWAAGCVLRVRVELHP